jgi:hypothetical protein
MPSTRFSAAVAPPAGYTDEFDQIGRGQAPVLQGGVITLAKRTLERAWS